jgi:hypothetical protein
MDAGFWVAVVALCAVIYGISKIGDILHEHGSFGGFLAMTILAGGLLLAVTRIGTQIAHGSP